ncbi:ABC transporter G family member 1-like isoform X3 [Actinidia eriantha]|uniref:ABC transporter G family member 1-like isoform X3 n=1 Tax=Actinidia eriantha TaxID=165200 RepID=UPI00258E547D|nr:ABC transporter G family member 1-like isoform X3 [Actinidia eriantha]
MDSQVNVPRWTPSLSPTRSIYHSPMREEIVHDDPETESLASHEEDKDHFAFNHMEKSKFPFSTCPNALITIPDPPSDIKTSMDVELVEPEPPPPPPPPTQPRVVCKGNGLFMTWKDLCVTVAGQKGGHRAILKGATGYVQPNEVLAIMGPSGSGKSTLLDALAGRLGSNTRQTGEILINGRKQTLAFGTSFFTLNGFSCPPMRNPSDHYLRTINKDFDVDIEQGLGVKMSTVEVINTLVKSYKSSEIYQQVQQQVYEICPKNGEILEEKCSQAGFITQCLVLTKRSFVNMYRDLGYYWLRLAIYIALCLCVGTIFYDIGSSYGSIQARGSMLMFVAAFLTFMAIGGFPSFVEDMKIFSRERLNGHYGVGAFVVGNTISSLPYLLLISLIPGAIAYYLVGLQRGVGRFAYFALLLFACMLLVESLMMIVASVVPDFLMGIITGAGIQGVMMLNGGFFRLPNDLPNPFWRYPMYYIAFHKYANQGFFKNEFEGLNFPNNQIGGPLTITGDEILRNIWQVEIGYSKWVDLAIVLGMVILYRLMFLGIIKTVEKVKPILMAATSKQSTHVEDPYSSPVH